MITLGHCSLQGNLKPGPLGNFYVQQKLHMDVC